MHVPTIFPARTRSGPSGPARRIRSARTLGAFALVGLVALVSACQPVTPPGGGSSTPADGSTAYVTGSAFGLSAVLVGPLGAAVGTAPLAGQSLPCNPTSNATYQNMIANSSVLVPQSTNSVAATGTIDDIGTVTFDHAAKTGDVVETSTVQNVSLLNGLITASAVTSKAHTTMGPNGTDHHTTDGTTGSTFANLVIAGVAQANITGANVRVDLPLGAGYVVLNEQTVVPATASDPEQIVVNAIHVYVNTSLNLAGDIEVAHAQTGTATAGGRLSGTAFLITGSLIPVLTTGILSNLGMPCQGTGGADLSSDQASLGIASVGSIGAGHQTVNGTMASGGNTSTVTATIGAINLLNGLVTADAVTAKAHATAGPSGTTTDAAGTTIANLKVNGKPIAASVPPNTAIALPGLGQVVLNEQVATSGGPHDASMTVAAIDIQITVSGNILGLPVGAYLVVAMAQATASS